jgi:hypothetical protein
MIVFGVPKLFCATSQAAVALNDMSVVTSAMRINRVMRDLLHESMRAGGFAGLKWKYYPGIVPGGLASRFADAFPVTEV